MPQTITQNNIIQALKFAAIVAALASGGTLRETSAKRLTNIVESALTSFLGGALVGLLTPKAFENAILAHTVLRQRNLFSLFSNPRASLEQLNFFYNLFLSAFVGQILLYPFTQSTTSLIRREMIGYAMLLVVSVSKNLMQTPAAAIHHAAATIALHNHERNHPPLTVAPMRIQETLSNAS